MTLVGHWWCRLLARLYVAEMASLFHRVVLGPNLVLVGHFPCQTWQQVRPLVPVPPQLLLLPLLGGEEAEEEEKGEVDDSASVVVAVVA